MWQTCRKQRAVLVIRIRRTVQGDISVAMMLVVVYNVIAEIVSILKPRC